jgi:hypothetical protein
MELEANEFLLGFREVKEYFEYLVQVDEWFRGVFQDFPLEFQSFKNNQKFVQLKNFLREKWLADAKYDRVAYQNKKNFIERMKEYLVGLIGGPHKRRCIRVVGNQDNWHDAFSLFLLAAHSQKLSSKQDLKSKIQGLLNP